MSADPQPPCPFTARVRGALGAEPDDELLAHLSTCAECQAALDEDIARDGILDRLHTTRRAPAAPPSYDPGRLPTFPRYRMLREIGRGGQGTVYEAIQESTGRAVAVKVLRSRIWDDERLRARIEREVSILGKLTHSNVCPVIDFVREGGLAGVVMPFLEGDPLSRRLRLAADSFRRTRDPQVAWTRVLGGPERSDGTNSRFARLGGLQAVLHLMEDIVEAVEAVHQAGVVHRDLKPANVIVRHDGRPVVLDFGLALDLSDGSPRLTQEGELHGTPTSMAPEQVAGKYEEIDVRTDVYALGVLMYELLAFEPPFQGSLALVLQRVSTGSVKRLRQVNPTVPRDLEAVCMKAMSGEPSRRYTSAAEMGADLARVRRLEPTVAKPVSSVTRLLLRVRRHPALSATVAVALALAVGLVLTRIFWWQSVGSLQAAVGEYLRFDRGQMSESELEHLPEFLGDDFESFLDAEGSEQLVMLDAAFGDYRGEGDASQLDLVAPRATVRGEGLTFVIAVPDVLEGGSLRLRDLETDEVVWREDLFPEGAGTVELRPPSELELVGGRSYEWSVRGQVAGGAARMTGSAVFRIASRAGPERTAASADAAQNLAWAQELLKYELAGEALEFLELVEVPVEREGRAQLDLMRVRAHLMMGREERARDVAGRWHAPGH